MEQQRLFDLDEKGLGILDSIMPGDLLIFQWGLFSDKIMRNQHVEVFITKQQLKNR